MNPIQKFCTWYMTRTVKQQQNQQLSEQDKVKRKMYDDLQELYDFVKWLNVKGFRNRRQRKAFWKDVANGKPALEEVIARIMLRYSPKVKEEEEKNAVQNVSKKDSK